MKHFVQLMKNIRKDSGLKEFQESRLKTIAAIVLFGFIIAFLYCLYNIWADNPYPYNTFLFEPDVRFSDLTHTVRSMKHGTLPYDKIGPGRGYFPFFYVLLYPFSFMGSREMILGIIIPFCVFYTALGLYFIKPGVKKYLAYTSIILFLSYPFLFLIDRGNVEMILYLFILMFIHFFIKGKYNIAALVLAAAINCKLYPGVLAVLFIKDKKYKAAALTVLYSAVFFGVGMFFCDFNFTGLKGNLDWFVKTYALTNDGIPYSHTIWGMYKYTLTFLCRIDYLSTIRAAELIKLMTFPYVLFTMAILAITSLYVIFVEKVLWKNVFLLISLFLILPQVSFDYTLISLMIPLILFIVSGKEDNGLDNKIFCIFWGIVMIPMNWAHLSGYPSFQYTVVLRPALIILMMSYIMFKGLLKSNLKNNFCDYFGNKG